MKLIEVLSASDLAKYKYEVVKKSDNIEIYQFTLQDGQRFHVKFKTLTSPESSEIYYKLLKYVQQPERLHIPAIANQIKKELGGIYYVTFQDADKEEDDFEMTDKNKDMFFILGHVTKIITDFVNSHKILELSFASESSELSRIKVYNRLSVIIPKNSNIKLLYVDRDEIINNYIFVSKI